jgi:hypothetical protein
MFYDNLDKLMSTTSTLPKDDNFWWGKDSTRIIVLRNIVYHYRDNILIPSGVCTLEDIKNDHTNKYQAGLNKYLLENHGLDIENETFITDDCRDKFAQLADKWYNDQLSKIKK